MRTLAGMLVVGVTLALAGAQQSVAGGHATRVTAATEAPSEARALSRAFASVAHAIGPSVVRIEVQTARERGTASGIIIDTRGYVVTSNHVLDGAPSIDVEIIFPDGRRMSADVVGRDAPSDVAVVRMRVPPGDLSAARFGDSDGAQIGEWVLAVGSPLGLEQTITAGIISGRGPLEGGDGIAAQVYLQTDAKVNPGNSGGPLVNLDGEVVGLAALISAGPGGSYGYAVPINLVRRTATALIEAGHMQHPYIGVALRDVRDLDRAEIHRWGSGARSLPPRGSLVTRVMRDAPAARAGLKPGDVIMSIDNRDVTSATELAAIISAQTVGARVVFGVVRRGATLVLPLSVADRPLTAKTAS
ncbi:MAG TPA: trypsin-like peptidase domain-containing protein [Polyangia bacterium]